MKTPRHHIKISDSGFLDPIRTARRRFVRHNDTSYASALAFRATISFPPLLLIVVSLASQFFDTSSIIDLIERSATQYFGSSVGELVSEIITSNTDFGSDQFVVAIVSTILSLYTASYIFRQLEIALNNVWEVKYQELSFLDDPLKWVRVRSRLYVQGITFTIGVLIIFWLSILASFTLNIDESQLGVRTQWWDDFQSLLTIVTYFFPLIFWTTICYFSFRYLPIHNLRWRQVLPGALLTGLTLALGQGIISGIVGNSRILSFYGVTSSILLILLWVYYSSNILLFGAEWTRALNE